jgi:hypothetical protein
MPLNYVPVYLPPGLDQDVERRIVGGLANVRFVGHSWRGPSLQQYVELAATRPTACRTCQTLNMMNGSVQNRYGPDCCYLDLLTSQKHVAWPFPKRV